MAGKGFAPKDIKAYAVAEGDRYEHETPDPPTGLMPASVAAWETWFDSWFSWFWTPSDIPALRQVIRLYDQVEREQWQRASELRLQMEAFGITPKGQLERRWAPMGATEPVKADTGDDQLAVQRAKRDRMLA